MVVEELDLAPNIIALINAVNRFLEHLDDDHVNSLLTEWPPVDSHRIRSNAPHALPVLAWLPMAAKAAGPDGELIVRKLASLADQIAWGQTYTVEDFGVGFLEKYGWTELIGQRGLITSDRIACGFLILGPRIEYPRHSHEAEEVYVPLTGQTLWQQCHQKWAYRKSCRPIYHAPPGNACHAN